MKEKMFLTSYLDKLYFVARRGKYVARIQVMSRDTLGQVTGQFLSCKSTISMSQRLLRYTDKCKTSRCSNRCIFSLTTCEVLRHAASFSLHLSGIL